uniref:Zinc finger protein 846-like n=1 Tax=Saccoglossus kowalevskii TaxID=10224 RepID=A0ABM0MLF1_SACKO
MPEFAYEIRALVEDQPGPILSLACLVDKIQVDQVASTAVAPCSARRKKHTSKRYSCSGNAFSWDTRWIWLSGLQLEGNKQGIYVLYPQCKQCEKRYTRLWYLKEHMLVHTEVKPFQCKKCEKCFTRSSYLKEHMLCKQCEKCFTRSEHLKEHMRTHTGLKPFQCKQCEKRFTQSWNLKQHMLTHTGLKPFQCKQCKKSFTFSGGLKYHMLTHTG